MTKPRYRGAHQAIRRAGLPFAYGAPCVRCGRVMEPGDDLDLDHTDDGRGYIGFAHARCNRVAGARRGVELARERRRIKMEDQVIAAAISVDRMHTSVVVAGRLDNGMVAFEVVEYADGSDTAALVADAAGQRQARTVIVDPRSPAATLIGPLQALEVNVTEPTTHQIALSHGRFVDEARAGRLRYRQHAALDAAMEHADTRPLAGGEALQRRADTDMSPLAAAELGVWAVLDLPPPAEQPFFAAWGG